MRPDTGGIKTRLFAGTTEDPGIPKRKNSRVRSISREGDLAWLAGIIDGEGNLQATVQFKKSGSAGNKLPYFEPKLRITNTDVRMIKKVSEIYVREGIQFFYTINAVSRYKNRKPTWKDQLEISVGVKPEIHKALSLVMPYLVNKQPYAKLMMKAIEWVQAQPFRGRNSAGGNYASKPQFVALIEAMKQERAMLIEPSTTIRRAREALSW